MSGDWEGEPIANIVMQSIGEDTEDDTELLIGIYEGADTAGKDLLDRAFIALNGWSLESLIKMHRGTYE